MKVQILFFSCGMVILAATAFGKEPVKKKEMQPAISLLQTQLMERQVSELMADRIGIRNEKIGGELAVLEYAAHEELLKAEALRFPADELYGSWDTCWVNPFRSRDVMMPDTFSIDCSSFVLPVTGTLKVTSKYGIRRRRMHRGIDLKVYVGDTVCAAFDGRVRIKSYERRGYGHYLVIRHPNGLETVYGHLSKYLVSENDIVRAGQPIALGGNTGRSSGSHLHFETRFLGQALDPSHLIDFESGTPHNDFYVFRKGSKAGGNIYTSTSERIVYHRVKEGETLSKIAQMYRTTVNELCRLNGISSTSKLRIGQSVRCGTVIAKTPKKAPAATETVVPSDTTQQKSETRTGEYHTVREHETLNSIARQHRTTVEALCRLNNILSTDVLRAGQEICYWMPAKKQEAKTDVTAKSRPVDANNVDEEADADEDVLAPVLTQPALKKASEAGNQTSEQTTALTEKAPLYYRVQKGDTLGTIARKHGVSVDRLCKLNNITQTTVLQIGRSLRCS